MQHFRGILWLTVLLAVALGAALADVPGKRARLQGSQPGEELPAPLPVPKLPAAPQFANIGSRTCASTACHGSVHRDPRSVGAAATYIRRDEYVYWSDHDPHARSLRTLENDRSRQMFTELGIKDAGGKIIDQRAYNNCLNCHATAYTNPATAQVDYESVSCEACHGPAEAWREIHYQRGWNPSLAARKGFADTKDLVARAQQCVQCHVGAADREVNHDLIAAGHPALKFELAAYHDLLPKHWNDTAPRAATKNFEMQLWEAGQRETLDQSLELLAVRLIRQSPAHPDHEESLRKSPVTPVWPEFAEFDCYACHHGLVDASWYRPGEKPPAALAAWNPWYTAQVPAEALPELATLREQMQSSWRRPEPGLMTSIVAARRAVAEHEFAGQERADMAAAQWDEAAQAYLRLAARFRARQDAALESGRPWPDEARLQRMLLEVRRNLAFKPHYDSPHATTAAERARILEQLKDLKRQLPAEGR